jgi:hypothetical protein
LFTASWHHNYSLAIEPYYILRRPSRITRKVCTFTDPFKASAHFNSDSEEDNHGIVLSDIRMLGMNGCKESKRKRSKAEGDAYECF